MFKWLENHVSLYFKINAVLLILIIIFSLWGIYNLGGLPNNFPWQWTGYQWHMIKFLWLPTIFYTMLHGFFVILLLKKKFFIFPIIFFTLLLTNNFSLGLTNILQYGFIDPVDNGLSIFWLLLLITSLIGTLLWFLNLKKNND